MTDRWIKVRASLMRRPKLIAMARHLAASPDFRRWLATGDVAVSADAMRCITMSLLTRVWSAAREIGHFVGDDLVIAELAANDVDLLAECPGVGDAMVTVGWLIVRDNPCAIIFPKFLEHNVPTTAAERQAAYRRRLKSDVGVTGALQRVAQPLRERCADVAQMLRNTSLIKEDIYTLSKRERGVAQQMRNASVTRAQRAVTRDTPKQDESPANYLADKFISAGGGGGRQRMVATFAAKLRAGVCTVAELEAAIDDDKRDASEPFWVMLQRHGWDSRRRASVPSVEEIAKQVEGM